MSYQILLSPSALRLLTNVADRRVLAKLREAIDSLAMEPAAGGKALIGDLSGYRSVRAAGQRYRIIYRVDADNRRVLIVALGIRRAGSKRDIYALARKLLRLRLVDPR